MLSLAKETLTPRLARNTIFIFRSVLAAVWIFEGVWHGFVKKTFPTTKLATLAENIGLSSDAIGFLVGGIAIAIGLWLLAGWTFRLCVFVQAVFILFILWLNYQDTMTWLSHFFERIPTITLMVMVWLYGPGSHILSRRRRRSSNTWKRG